VDLSLEIEALLRVHRLPGLEDVLPTGEFVHPHYDRYSIANLPATIAAALGAELNGVAPPLPSRLWSDLTAGVRRVVTVLLDAVGYLPFRRLLADGDPVLGRLVEAGVFFPLTSVFPTTTAAAVPTLWTGRPPADHGFVSSESLVPVPTPPRNTMDHLVFLFNHLKLIVERGKEVEELRSLLGLAQALSLDGRYAVVYIYPPRLQAIPFTLKGTRRLSVPGAGTIEGHISFNDPTRPDRMWGDLRRALVQRREGCILISGYWGGTDALAHFHGPDGESFYTALRRLIHLMDSEFLSPLPAAARDGTLLVIVADHGQTTLSPEQAVRLSDHPALQSILRRPPVGDPRAPFLFVRPGQSENLRDYVAEHMGERFVLLETERALEAGLLGPGTQHPRLRDRLGDFILLAREGGQFITEEIQSSLRGHHGGLAPGEVLVPLLMVRLDGM